MRTGSFRHEVFDARNRVSGSLMRDGGAFGAVGDGLTLKTDPPLSAAADKDGAPARERLQEPAERLSETGESAAIAGGAEARYNYVSVVHR